MPGLVVTINGKNNIQPALNDVERAAKAFQARLNRNITVGLGQWMGTGVAPNPLAKGLHDAAGEGFNLNGILRETLVVFREIGRGNWARVPGSLSLIAQYAGVLKYLLTPLVGIVAGLGIGTYYWVKHLREAVTESKNLNEMFSNIRSKYTEMAKAIEEQHQAMMRANNEAADYAAWQAKLGKETESATDRLNEQIAAMREEAELRKMLAQEQGRPKAYIDGIEKEQRQKELDATNIALLQARRKAEQDKLDADSAHSMRLGSDESFTKKSAQNSDFQNLAERVQKVFDQLDPKTKDQIQSYLNTINSASSKRQMSSRDIASLKNAREALNAYGNQEFGGLDVDGKKVRASISEMQNVFLDGAAKQKLLNYEIEQLAKTNRALKDAEEAAKQNAEKSSESVIQLKKERDKLAADIKLHSQYDPAIDAAARGRGGGERRDVTERERTGFGVSGGATIELIDVAKKHAALASVTNAKLDTIIEELREGGF